MARPQPNSLPPFSSTFAAPVEPAPSTITRSMSRRTLVSSRPAPTTTAAPSAGMTRSKSGLPRARPSLDLSAVASTSTSTVPASNTLARARTSASLSSRASVTNTTTKTSTAPTRRRVLGEAKNIGASASEFGALQGAKKTGTRRLSRADAASMTGMGIVKVGPAVKAQRSPRKVVAEGVNDPFSTSFKAPLFTFGATTDFQQANEQPHASSLGRGDERPFASLPSAASTRHINSQTASSTSHGDLPPIPSGPFDLTSPRKRDAPRSPTKLPQLSPARRRLFGAGENMGAIPLHNSPPVRRSSLDDDMDVDDASGQAATPRAAKPSKHGAHGDSSEDELDFLSPRKKKRSASVSAGDSQPSHSSSIRSPPKKRAVTSTRAGATSVPTSRAPVLRAPLTTASALASHTGLRRPIPPTVEPTINPQVLSAPSRPAGLVSKYAPRASASHPQQQPTSFTTSFGYQSSSASTSAAKTQAAAISAVQLAQQQAQTWRSSSSNIPRFTTGASSRPSPASAMEVDSSMSEVGERSLFEDRSRDTTITDIEEEDGEEDNSSMAVGNVSVASTASVSDETSKRLANLQSMLSRLQMPRASTGSRSSLGSAAGSSSGLPTRTDSKTLTGAFEKEYTVPLAPADESRSTSTRPRARASLSSIPSSTSTSTTDQRQSNIALGRRRHSISTRPSTTGSGIVNTSSRSGPLSSAAGPSQHQSNIRPPRRTSNLVPTSSSTATIAAIADGELSAQPRSNALQGVIAYIDVRTGEGDDAGMIFADMLKSMGARVTTRPTLTLTHIIYKSGRPGTLQRYRTQPDPKPHLVGISWVVRCAELSQRVDEVAYVVECGKEPTFQKRRRSMEPRALAALSANAPSTAGAQKGLETNDALKATIAASIERARRKSLQFAPKIGSPLAKRVFVMPVEQPNDEEDEDMA